MDDKENFERMQSGRIYNPGAQTLMNEQANYLDVMYDFNATRPSEIEKRQRLMKEMFAEIGDNCWIESPVYANWGCRHVHFGHDVYANFHLTLVDDAHIYVGDNVMFTPNVTVVSATHPIYPELRRRGLQFNVDVHIGNNVWIGAGSTILPGITIGDNSVIGAGSIVTKDIPANVVAVGNPCRVMREIGERDREFYYKDRRVDI